MINIYSYSIRISPIVCFFQIFRFPLTFHPKVPKKSPKTKMGTNIEFGHRQRARDEGLDQSKLSLDPVRSLICDTPAPFGNVRVVCVCLLTQIHIHPPTHTHIHSHTHTCSILILFELKPKRQKMSFEPK